MGGGDGKDKEDAVSTTVPSTKAPRSESEISVTSVPIQTGRLLTEADASWINA